MGEWQDRGAVVRFYFTDEERDRAIRVGNARQAFHDERKTPGAYGLDVDQAEAGRINRVGALAELCVASFVGLADRWVEVTADYHSLQGDVVPGLEVRSTRANQGSLLLHPRDADDRVFVCVRTGQANRGWVDLVGWLTAGQGKRDEWWPGKYPKRPCFMVPAGVLNPMLELPWFVAADHEDVVRCEECAGVVSGLPSGLAWQAWCRCEF